MPSVTPDDLLTLPFLMIFVGIFSFGLGRINESIRAIEPADCTCICETAMESTP
jgi:hypothetical protein